MQMKKAKDPSVGNKKYAQPMTMLKRIGSTTYEVVVHFSNTSTEKLEDKILRMIEREVGKSA